MTKVKTKNEALEIPRILSLSREKHYENAHLTTRRVAQQKKMKVATFGNEMLVLGLKTAGYLE